ncbi:MAG: hypothetical protein ACREMN_00810 [Gemmatimonadales bacterium]
MNTRRVQAALIIIGVLGLMAAFRVMAWPLVRIELAPSTDSVGGAPAAHRVQRIVAESIAAIVARDPFRIGRLPAITAYDPVRLAQPVVPPPPRPVLTLVGVVDGTDASAVVEGLPGVEGSRVVRVGDVVAGLRIKAIANRRVTIVGMDTTWVLEVREPWKQ